MAAEIVFYAILVYLVYRFVFNFLIPVSQAGKQMKDQFRNVHEHMEQQANAARQQQAAAQPKPAPKASETAGDYIDFEEVK